MILEYFNLECLKHLKWKRVNGDTYIDGKKVKYAYYIPKPYWFTYEDEDNNLVYEDIFYPTCDKFITDWNWINMLIDALERKYKDGDINLLHFSITSTSVRIEFTYGTTFIYSDDNFKNKDFNKLTSLINGLNKLLEVIKENKK